MKAFGNGNPTPTADRTPEINEKPQVFVRSSDPTLLGMAAAVALSVMAGGESSPYPPRRPKRGTYVPPPTIECLLSPTGQHVFEPVTDGDMVTTGSYKGKCKHCGVRP